MSAPARCWRAASLLEGLLADPQLRAEFHRRPGRTCRDFDLPELATDLETRARGILPLEQRESRSSLAGVAIAAAAEGIGLIELAVGHLVHHAGSDWPAARLSDARPAAVPRTDSSPQLPERHEAAKPDRLLDTRRDEGSALAPAAHASAQPAFPGADASRAQIASWMAHRAAAVGVPGELPVMAALAQSGLDAARSPGDDAAGFFRMSVGAWDRGPYRGFPEDPDLQLDWFLDRLAVVRAERVAAGDSAYGQDPSSWHEWISTAVERPPAQQVADGGPLEAAQRLLDVAHPGSEMVRQPAHASLAAERAVQIAQRYLGQPYRWGGASPATGFDCSGLVQYAYGQAGVTLPRVTHQQFAVGELIGRDQLTTGDIVFFRDATGYIHHEGIYVGGDEFLHAPHTGDVVKVSSLKEPYYAAQFAGGRRVGQRA
jgi:cell wall-associated NlpC family hydrolase